MTPRRSLSFGEQLTEIVRRHVLPSWRNRSQAPDLVRALNREPTLVIRGGQCVAAGGRARGIYREGVPLHAAVVDEDAVRLRARFVGFLLFPSDAPQDGN